MHVPLVFGSREQPTRMTSGTKLYWAISVILRAARKELTHIGKGEDVKLKSWAADPVYTCAGAGSASCSGGNDTPSAKRQISSEFAQSIQFNSVWQSCHRA